MDILLIIISTLIIIGLIYYNYILYKTYQQRNIDLIKEIESLKTERITIIKEAKADALKRSRSTMRGQATEHLAPLLIPNFNAKDYRFIGNPIDYLLCKNLSNHTDGNEEEPIFIYLLDIKTGTSQLSKVQRRIKDAVMEGRVAFATYNSDTQELKQWSINGL